MNSKTYLDEDTSTDSSTRTRIVIIEHDSYVKTLLQVNLGERYRDIVFIDPSANSTREVAAHIRDMADDIYTIMMRDAPRSQYDMNKMEAEDAVKQTLAGCGACLLYPSLSAALQARTVLTSEKPYHQALNLYKQGKFPKDEPVPPGFIQLEPGIVGHPTLILHALENVALWNPPGKHTFSHVMVPGSDTQNEYNVVSTFPGTPKETLVELL